MRYLTEPRVMLAATSPRNSPTSVLHGVGVTGKSDLTWPFL